MATHLTFLLGSAAAGSVENDAIKKEVGVMEVAVVEANMVVDLYS